LEQPELKELEAPPRPSINDERSFIDWMLRYDDSLRWFRKMSPLFEDFEGVIQSTIAEIQREITDYIMENP